MKLYDEVREGRFLSRPNRFIARVEIDGKTEICHVKNTGRCRELLLPGCRVVLAFSHQPNRKTQYDLVAVYKGERLINMDSQAPNKVAMEGMAMLFPGATEVKPETVFGDSRLDFSARRGEKRILLEVKGVTLEEDNVCLFPDAPTERGVRHLRELEKAAGMGYTAGILFVIQMENTRYFAPNEKTHPEFARALRSAEQNGVHILAYDCTVTPADMTLRQPVEIRLRP